MPAVADSVWTARDTTPAEIESALRDLRGERFAEDQSFVPARVLNLISIVDREWSGEIANRMRGVGRFHPSRTVVCAVEPRRTALDATVIVASDTRPAPGEIALTRETVIITMGTGHLPHVDSIVDALVITDLPTMAWSPHGHRVAIDALRELIQIVLLDSLDDPELDEGLARAHELATADLKVVDLAWLRSLPWRERLAATFDPPALRHELRRITAVNVRHNPDSAAAALLLVGWLASRLGWKPTKLIERRESLTGHLRARSGEVSVTLDPVPQEVRGLAGVTLETASGASVAFDRGPGGLKAVRRDRRGVEQHWTILGASRGEGGILGEGIRQALNFDPTYADTLEAAMTMAP
ncbi:MAG TPA: glucose-6-phosphate dehydrogenase assembly protein OpcA [Solirubrobacteraceae bacterium]|nr:glucose-6-phosphate dehydrogenase assembly protein OpcA [Solirubrobacteraceae bacterium]